MLTFSDWLTSKTEGLEDKFGEAPINGIESEPGIGEDKINVDVDLDDKEEVGESRPYTRSLRFYPSITAPTGGGPSFQYLSQDAQAAGSAKKQGMKAPKLISAEPSPGMSDKSIKKRLKDWAKLSGLV